MRVRWALAQGFASAGVTGAIGVAWADRSVIALMMAVGFVAGFTSRMIKGPP